MTLLFSKNILFSHASFDSYVNVLLIFFYVTHALMTICLWMFH